MSTAIAIIAAIALLIATVITLLMRLWAPSLGFIDIPNDRSSHLLPTARGGGIAIVFAFFSAIILLVHYELLKMRIAEALIVAGGVVAVIGLIDDRHPLPAFIRLGVHTAAAVLAILLIGGLPDTTVSTWGLCGNVLGGFVAVLTVIWGINLFNFMDGIDGIAGSEVVFFASAAALLNWLVGGNLGITGAMICLGTASLGFLFFNWPPASIFMGDVGSGFLGMTLAVLALGISQSAKIPLEVWPILGGVFLVDATVTLLRRILRGDRWRESHRAHAYQHLARMSGHRQVTLAVIGVNVFWLFPWAWYTAMHGAHGSLYLIAALLPLVAAALLLDAGIQRT